MELRLSNRGKPLRWVRPEREPLFEWLRAMRHNAFCDLIHWTDSAMTWLRRVRYAASQQLKAWEAPAWVSPLGERFREQASGRALGQGVRSLFARVRERGVRESFWPLIFVIGLLFGVALKWQAEDSLTIGYEDYKLDQEARYYDLNALALAAKAGPRENPNPRAEYPSCTIAQP